MYGGIADFKVNQGPNFKCSVQNFLKVNNVFTAIH